MYKKWRRYSRPNDGGGAESGPSSSSRSYHSERNQKSLDFNDAGDEDEDCAEIIKEVEYQPKQPLISLINDADAEPQLQQQPLIIEKPKEIVDIITTF